MGIDLMVLKSELTSRELRLLDSEFRRLRRSPLMAWLFWVFMGIFGGHRYYLGDRGRGVAQTIVFLIALFSTVLWNAYVIDTTTSVEQAIIYGSASMVVFLVPSTWALIDALFLNRRLRKKNEQIERDLILQIKDIRSGGE